MIQKEKKAFAAFIFRIFCFLLGTSGIVLHMLSDGIVESEFMMKHKLAYFTLQTNIISVLIFGILIGKTIVILCKEKRFVVAHIHASIHLACTLYITITMLGFWLALAPFTGIPKDPFLLSNTLTLHAFTPIVAILDYFIFAKHGTLQKRDVLKWLVYPFGYYIFANLYSATITEPYYHFNMNGERIALMYPYPFFDPQIMGIWGVVGTIIGLAILFALLGLLYIFVDTKLETKNNI